MAVRPTPPAVLENVGSRGKIGKKKEDNKWKERGRKKGKQKGEERRGGKKEIKKEKKKGEAKRRR